MRHEAKYREFCASRGLGPAEVDAAIAAVEALEAVLTEQAGGGPDLESAMPEAVDGCLAGLLAEGGYSDGKLLALARYCLVAGNAPVAIRLLAYLLPVGVLPAMAERLASLEGSAVRDEVFAGIAIPPPGSPPEAYPEATAAFVTALGLKLGAERAARVLSWNVHGVPASAFAAEREAFLAAPSLEAWLEGYHARQVAVLEKHAADGSLWYEQRITPRVVEFVRGNPEILGAVREGDSLVMTKIPYDPDAYLGSSDPLERRRLACHCPLAASAITAGGSRVPVLWCACSAGYEKALFDAVFGEETEARVLESVLGGADRCRFSLRIPDSVLERCPPESDPVQ